MAEALASLGRGLVDQFIIKGYFLAIIFYINNNKYKNTYYLSIFHTDEVCLLKQLVEKFVEADRKNRLYGR